MLYICIYNKHTHTHIYTYIHMRSHRVSLGFSGVSLWIQVFEFRARPRAFVSLDLGFRGVGRL